MRIVVQRVKNATVSVDGEEKARIGQGLLLLVGIGKGDGIEEIGKLAKKVAGLRIFEDKTGKMNLDIGQVNGQILSVPQFTLYADSGKGNRPGFDAAAEPAAAKEYWQKFNTLLRALGIEVREGAFGAHMQVGLVNDGPVTLCLDGQ